MTRVAAIQMVSAADLRRNLKDTAELLTEAASKGAQVATLPENFSFMGREEHDKLALAEEEGDGPIQSFLAATARSTGLWIVAGTVPLRCEESSRVASACLVFDDHGNLAARYDKIHLFDVTLPGGREQYEESATVRPGDTPVCVDTPAGRLGLSVCYDLRFPELYRQLTECGAEWFCIPSAFTATTGRAHWEVLLRARAIENLCYVVAPAQSGIHENGRETYGDSMIVAPWGRILDRLARGSGNVIADLDLVAQRKLRQNFPTLDHRRLSN